MTDDEQADESPEGYEPDWDEEPEPYYPPGIGPAQPKETEVSE